MGECIICEDDIKIIQSQGDQKGDRDGKDVDHDRSI